MHALHPLTSHDRLAQARGRSSACSTPLSNPNPRPPPPNPRHAACCRLLANQCAALCLGSAPARPHAPASARATPPPPPPAERRRAAAVPALARLRPGRQLLDRQGDQPGSCEAVMLQHTSAHHNLLPAPHAGVAGTPGKDCQLIYQPAAAAEKRWAGRCWMHAGCTSRLPAASPACAHHPAAATALQVCRAAAAARGGRGGATRRGAAAGGQREGGAGHAAQGAGGVRPGGDAGGAGAQHAAAGGLDVAEPGVRSRC